MRRTIARCCRLVCGWFALSLLVGLASTLPTQARDLNEYFAGKTVTIVVGSAPGGGNDFNARLIARFAPKYFPGKPVFIVQNVPGGGELKGLQTGMMARPDGLTIATMHQRWAVASALGRNLGPFNVQTARIVGTSNAVKHNEMVCADRKTYASWDALRRSGAILKVGASAAGARITIGAVLVEMAGGPLSTIFGYGGVAETTAAFDRGEVTGVACPETDVPRLFPEWLEQKRLTPLFWWSAPPSKDYLARIGSPEKPVQLFELPGISFSDESKTVLDLAVRSSLFANTFVLPAAVPDEVYATWKQVFAAILEDPELKAASLKGGYDIGLGTAEQFSQLIADIRKLPPSAAEQFRKVMGVEL